MPPKIMAQDLPSLHKATASLRALLQSFQAAVQQFPPPRPIIENSPNPLALLSDASRLLKAQTTKLSLLLLNKPFTPSEIAHILDTLAKSVLPALMSGLELCHAERFTRCLYEHVRCTLATVWREVLSLLSSIPDSENDMNGSRGKATLASTGRLWEECDKLIHLADKGLVDLVGEQVGGDCALLEDAIVELNEWDPDENDDDDDDDDGEDASGEEGNEEQGSREVVHTPTTSDEERLPKEMGKLTINPRVALKAKALKYLRLVRLLYPALRKRRIRTFPNIMKSTGAGDMPTPQQIQDFDNLTTHTKRFTNEADEIVGRLYENDVQALDWRLGQLANAARSCVTLTRRTWNGKEDEYSAWVDKWMVRLEELERG
ncbi:MAG: hypothetical protein Q9217_004301 [Psora testacea]